MKMFNHPPGRKSELPDVKLKFTVGECSSETDLTASLSEVEATVLGLRNCLTEAGDTSSYVRSERLEGTPIAELLFLALEEEAILKPLVTALQESAKNRREIDSLKRQFGLLVGGNLALKGEIGSVRASIDDKTKERFETQNSGQKWMKQQKFEEESVMQMTRQSFGGMSEEEAEILELNDKISLLKLSVDEFEKL